MPHCDDVRSRTLHVGSLTRELTDSEVQEAAGLVERLCEVGKLHLAGLAYDAIRRTYKRRKRDRSRDCGPLRFIERTANALLEKTCRRLSSK